MKARREFTYKEFRKKYGLTLKDRSQLKRLRIIEIFQGGYKGHSLEHHKKVRIRNLTRFRNYLSYIQIVKKEKSSWLLPQPKNFVEFERESESSIRSYFKKEPKKTKSNLPETPIQPRPIKRSEFRQIAKTIRGDYEYIRNYDFKT